MLVRPNQKVILSVTIVRVQKSGFVKFLRQVDQTTYSIRRNAKGYSSLL